MSDKPTPVAIALAILFFGSIAAFGVYLFTPQYKIVCGAERERGRVLLDEAHAYMERCPDYKTADDATILAAIPYGCTSANNEAYTRRVRETVAELTACEQRECAGAVCRRSQ